MLLVQFRVQVGDVERLRQAFIAHRERFEADGARNQSLYAVETAPGAFEVSMFAEWASHDAMHESSERRGPAFQADAGTEGLEWETRLWERLA
jgi:hypothetical protein